MPLNRLGMTLAICAGIQGALPPVAVAQDTSTRLPDSTRARLLGCGTHGPTLQRRVATREVVQALGKVSACPEGAQIIAGLWASETGSDFAYFEQLVGVSSITDPRVADALVRMFSNRARPTAVRMLALGSVLKQLTGVYGSRITIATVSREVRLDSLGRAAGPPVDSTRAATLETRGHPVPPLELDAASRAAIVAAINRVAGDASEVAEMRLAAREVAKVLSQRSR